MALVGRLHPLLIHFPIALVLAAFASPLAAFAGWRLAGDPIVDPAPLLEWHRWLSVAGTAAVLVAAIASTRLHSGSASVRWVYGISLLLAAALVGVAAHLGGVLVWGADFLPL